MVGRVTSKPSSFGKTLDTYLKQEGSGKKYAKPLLDDNTAQRKRAKSRSRIAQDETATGYAHLKNAMEFAGKHNTGRYDTAREESEASTEQTRARILAGYANSAENVDELRGNLGIEGPQSQAQQYAARDAGRANAGALATGQSQQDFLQSMGMRQGNWIQSMGAAGEFAGAQAKSDLSKILQERQGQIETQRAEILANALQQAQAMAESRYSADYGQFSDQRAYKDSRDDLARDRAFEEKQYADQLSAQALAMGGSSGRSSGGSSRPGTTVRDVGGAGNARFAPNTFQGTPTSQLSSTPGSSRSSSSGGQITDNWQVGSASSLPKLSRNIAKMSPGDQRIAQKMQNQHRVSPGSVTRSKLMAAGMTSTGAQLFLSGL